jgi:antitoxin MazE
MKAKVVRIGNSKGIRLPKAVLEQCHLEHTVELEVEDGFVIIRPAHAPRSGWDEVFSEMAEKHNDALLDANALPATEWDKTEWRW